MFPLSISLISYYAHSELQNLKNDYSNGKKVFKIVPLLIRSILQFSLLNKIWINESKWFVSRGCWTVKTQKRYSLYRFAALFVVTGFVGFASPCTLSTSLFPVFRVMKSGHCHTLGVQDLFLDGILKQRMTAKLVSELTITRTSLLTWALFRNKRT